MFAQNHLCEYGENNEQIQEELERTMALLAFEDPNDSPFCDLLQTVQRQRLASEVNSAMLEYENLESQSKLSTLIKMLVWSQDLLDKRSINYPKMIDMGNARVEEVNFNNSS
jgi:glucose-induced degradation protein 8